MQRLFLIMSMITVIGLRRHFAGSQRRASRGTATAPATERRYLLDRVDDAAVVQVYADGFAQLPLKDKTLIWHLYQAAIAGRDIFYDQRYVHNLEMRDVLEAILTHAATVDPATLQDIQRYTKLFWINTGPYNNLTARKFVLTCSPEAFAAAAHAAEKSGAAFPAQKGETLDQLLARLKPQFFDADVDPMVTAKTPPPGKDILTASANNLYAGVSMKDLDGFHEQYPLNARLTRENGKLTEEVYRVGGRYSGQISAIIGHLQAAIPFATEPMADALKALIKFYQTGETSDREAYDIAWVKDKASPVDTINGFIEVYLDARGMKGAWEALVFYVNREKTSEIQKLAHEAQWFEDRMPWDAKYRKPDVQGITANAIDVVIETGDSGPVTPIGINLPNDQHVRERYGSKSVSLSNVNEAYDKSTLPAMRSEFSWTPEETARAVKWSAIGGRAVHQHARSHRSRVGPHLRSPERQAAERAQGTVLGARRSARRSGGALLPARSETGRARPGLGRRPGRHGAGRVRSADAQRARPAAPCPHRDPARRRSHAQPPDDRPVADEEHQGDRGAAARRQDLLRRRPTSRRSAKARDGCSPKCSGSSRKATIRRPRRSSKPTACTSSRRCATRSCRASIT